MISAFTNYEVTSLIFSGIVTLSTVLYVIFTWNLVSESKKTREFQITPEISCRFDFNETDASHMYILIENVGIGTAQNLKFEVKKDFQNYQIPNLKPTELGIFKNGLTNFYPHQRFRYYVTDLSQNNDDKINDNIEFVVSYTNILGKKYSRPFNLKVAEVDGMGKLTPSETYLGRIAYELENIRKYLKQSKN
jgi:hypothetical protein